MSNWDNISSIINTGNVPFKPEHWENLSNRLDKIQLQDEKIREKLNENPSLKAPKDIWGNIANKIDTKSFTSSDFKIREILNGASKAYKRKHWYAFLALFYANKVWLKKWSVAAVGAAVTFLSVALWNVFEPAKQKDSIAEKSSNDAYPSQNHETNKNTITIRTKNLSPQDNNNNNNASTKNQLSNTDNLSENLNTNNNSTLSKKSNTIPTSNTNKKARFSSVNQTHNTIHNKANLKDIIDENKIDELTENELFDTENLNENLNQNSFLSSSEMYPNVWTKVEGIHHKLLSSITFNNYPIKVNVEYESPKESAAQYHIGYLNILNPFQNAHVPGLMGENHLQFQSSIHWQRILVDNLFNSFEMLYPLQNNLNYQHKINNNWAFGVNYQNKLTQNWLGQIAGVAVSYNKNIGGGNLRLGLGNNFHQEQIIAKNLSFREQLALTNEINFTEVRNGKLKPLQKNSLNFSVGYFHNKFFIQLMQWEKVVWISNDILSDFAYQKLEAGYNFNEFKNFRSTVFGGVFNDTENSYYAGASVAYKNRIAFNVLVMPYNYTELSLTAKYKNIRSSVFWRSDLLNQSFALSNQSIYTGSTGLNVFWIW